MDGAKITGFAYTTWNVGYYIQQFITRQPEDKLEKYWLMKTLLFINFYLDDFCIWSSHAQ